MSPALQNDHKALMKEIEEGLHEVHAEARRQKASGEPPADQGASAGSRTQTQPFLRVDQVDAGSPASEAVSAAEKYHDMQCWVGF